MIIEIDSCSDCCFKKFGNYYSLDGFDRGRDLICTKSNNVIVSFVERDSETKNLKIPEWCIFKNQK